MSRAPIDANAVHAVSPARATTHQHAGRAAARRDELITISHPGLLSRFESAFLQRRVTSEPIDPGMGSRSLRPASRLRGIGRGLIGGTRVEHPLMRERRPRLDPSRRAGYAR
jgi:hypothetical protein